MFKVLSIVTVIIVGMLVLGGCGSPAAKTVPSGAESPATPTAVVNTPVSAPAPAPATAAPIAPAPALIPAPAPAAAITSVEPATLTYSDLKITLRERNATEVKATVTVKVTNAGGPGTSRVRLDYHDPTGECTFKPEPIDKNVTLAGGASAVVDFPINLPAEFVNVLMVDIGPFRSYLEK